MADELPSDVSAERLEAGWPYLDVRTEGEFAAGHPPGAVNIPAFNAGPMGMQPNPDFMAEVEKVFTDKDADILVVGVAGEAAGMGVDHGACG